MSVDQFETHPKHLPAGSSEARKIAELVKRKVVGDFSMFDNDGQFRLIEPKETRYRFYEGESDEKEYKMWAPGLLQYDPLEYRLTTNRYDGFLEVRSVPDISIRPRSVYLYPLSAHILPNTVRFALDHYVSKVGESGYLLRPAWDTDRIIHGVYDSRGILVETTIEELDYEAQKASQGEKPTIFSTLPFIRPAEEHRNEELKVIELSLGSESDKAQDMVVLTTVGQATSTQRASLIPRRIEHPLDPKKWGVKL